MTISLSVHIKSGALKVLSSSKLCASKIHEDFFSVASNSVARNRGGWSRPAMLINQSRVWRKQSTFNGEIDILLADSAEIATILIFAA